MAFRVDHVAKRIALTRWVLPECLHVPTAALDEDAITSYIGDIERVLAEGKPRKAFLVKAKEPSPIERQYPIWELPQSEIFHKRQQVWVHVSYSHYRSAYRRAFPDESIDGKILSHAMNRKVAALKGFSYVRITPTSRSSNSSSAFSENWAVAALRSDPDKAGNQRYGAFIQYADLSDLMLMLDIRIGGGVMDIVNEGQRLVTPKKPAV